MWPEEANRIFSDFQFLYYFWRGFVSFVRFLFSNFEPQVKSKAKDELNRMLDVLNIQVDNPCAVLDQENSKKFLQGSERDKYAFFMKATDLDRILAVSPVLCGVLSHRS